MENCVFCKIVRGEIPSRKIYETERVLVFSPIKTEARGHTLVIPKTHYENIFDVSDNDLKETILVLKKIAIAIKKGLNADGVNILNASGKEAQQSVFHLHFHIIPRFKNDGVDAWMKTSDLKEYNIDEINSKIKGKLF